MYNLVSKASKTIKLLVIYVVAVKYLDWILSIVFGWCYAEFSGGRLLISCLVSCYRVVPKLSVISEIT